MTSTCRICRRTGVKEFTPLVHMVSTQRKAVVDMFNTITGSKASKIEESDRLPQQVCNGCLRRLERTYSLLMQCRRSLRILLLHPLDGTSDVKRCLMCCEPYGREELVTANDVDERSNTKISDMIELLMDIKLIEDPSQKYACASCMIKLSSSYEFKRKCRKSEADWFENVLYPWETMKVDSNNPKHLLVDLYAEVVQGDEGTAHCSICLLSVDTEQLGRICQGCKLKFRKDNEMQVGLPAEEECSVPPEIVADEVEIEYIELDELAEEEPDQELDMLAEEENGDERPETDFPTVIDHQEVDLLAEEETDQELDMLAEEDTDDEQLEMDYSKESHPESNVLGYVDKPEKVFDIIEDYPGDPFPTVLRKGPVCCTCFMFFATKSDMADHQAQTHSGLTCSGTLPCEFCENHADSIALEQHRKSMDTFVYDFCRSCKVVFESPKFLRQHKFKYHMDTETAMETQANYGTELVFYYFCCVPSCVHRYSTEELLRKHCEVAHRPKEKPLQENTCPYCNLQIENLTKHWRYEKTSYKCLVDGCDFTRLCHKTILMHCSQRPHSKYVHKKEMETKILVPDLKHFTVIGQLDRNTDIFQRQGQLCCRCFILFDTKEELEAHCSLHRIEDDQPYQCQLCSRGFKSKPHQTNHSKLQTEPIHYYCRICKTVLWRPIDYVFHRASDHLYDFDLSDHIETVEDHSFTCCGCWESFETEEELVGHRRIYHPPPPKSQAKYPKKRPKCDYCHKAKESLEALEQHVRFYESGISHRCKVAACNFQTKDMNHIRKHILLRHKQEADDIIATIQVPGSNHKRRRKKKDLADHNCCVISCTFRCTDYDALIEHGKAEHAEQRYQFSIKTGGRQYSCAVCCKGFGKLPALKTHKAGFSRIYCRGCRKKIRRSIYNTHVEECIKSWRCTHCGEVMRTKLKLMKHLKQIHSETNGTNPPSKLVPMSVCKICGKQRRNMYAHMQTHNKKRIYKCPTCVASFNTFLLWSIHQRSHRNEQNFQCRLGCEKRYKAAGDRARHEKSAHLGIKPFACNLCSKSFVRDRDLRLHQREHTGAPTVRPASIRVVKTNITA